MGSNEDVFLISITLPDRPFAKRGILSVVNSLYDPLGIAAPVSLAGRLIQREVLPTKKDLTSELLKFGWDDELPQKYVDMVAKVEKVLTVALNV